MDFLPLYEKAKIVWKEDDTRSMGAETWGGAMHRLFPDFDWRANRVCEIDRMDHVIHCCRCGGEWVFLVLSYPGNSSIRVAKC